MDIHSLSSNTNKELIKICRGNKNIYKGYTKYKKKSKLIDFIINRYESSLEIDYGNELCNIFEEKEDIPHLLKERPSYSYISYFISNIDLNHRNINYQPFYNERNSLFYRLYKEDYYKKYNKIGEELILFHGTNKENIDHILEDDFSLTISPNNGNRYGRGIYFTNNINKAISYSKDNIKYILICVVHIGDVVQGRSSMDIHPKMDNNKYYDTSVDNIESPIEFIKKKNHTYNILGTLTIQNKIIEKYNLTINNYTNESVKIFWIPDNINLYDPQLDIRTKGKMMGIVKPNKKYKIITQNNHKFICANSIGYIRLIIIKKKNENIILK